MSQTVEVVLDDQGRIVLPAGVRRLLGLAPGMTLVVEQATDDAAYLRVETEPPRLVDRQGILVVQAQPVGDLTDSLRQHREQRVADLAWHVDE